MKHKVRKTAGAVCFGLVLSGCMDASVGRGAFSPSGTAFSRNSASPRLLANDNWWKTMRDPQLDRLIEVATLQNLSLLQAVQRIRSAQAVLDGARIQSVFGSSIDAGYRGSENTGPTETGTAELSLNWMFDPWGERAARERNASATVAVRRAEGDAARLAMLLGMSTAYIDYRYRQAVLDILQRQERTARQTLSNAQRLAEVQSATRVDVLRARAALSQARTDMPGTQAAVETRRNEIAVLLGRSPLPPLKLADGGQPKARLPDNIGVPTDLLRNRPDVQAAEWRYRAALAQMDVDRAARYPKLSLSGVLNWSLFASNADRLGYFLGPNITFPDLPSTARASITRSHAEAEIAWLDWKSSVLDAILEVENALARHRAAAQTCARAQETVRLNREVLELTRQLYASEEVTISEVLDAEDALTTSELSLAAAVRDMTQTYVEVNVNLGAGHAPQSVAATQ
ncbi:efflux transporter outer membrane subunit [Sagittula sp. NFXS13]|uniref:efflux transporter outer membrane subunit n=1 Tax=Sagittula sp. NFXS13 TaxID=2819095 RepID=UPI0032DF65E9